MNKIFAFLETLGRDARLAQSSPTELASAARAAGVEPNLAEALARRDHVAFNRLFSALLLSLGLAVPPPGHAVIFAPSEKEAEESTASEEEAPADTSTPRSAPASTPASTPATAPATELPTAGGGEADPAPEAGFENDISESADDAAPPEDENTQSGDDPTTLDEAGEEAEEESSEEAEEESSEEAEEESSEEDDSAEPEEDFTAN